MFLDTTDVIGDPAQVDRYQKFLANIISVIAPEMEYAEDILDSIKNIEDGIEKTKEISVEYVTVTLSLSGVQVDFYYLDDDLVGSPEGRFTLAEFKHAIDAWCDFLELPESFKSVVEVDL